ncbi:DNA (cytosine-5)-methyltransferase 1 [Marivirga sericea]|uniref:Cytosine-specific methyltransferase n=1 Tax=Marivirga sericea TaxID=1028 RepID=A0A1X7I5I7_9BACT|nr:DNA (cytosine-5-)-methyltransferase [Marivirga sericea]SMG09117.1 DNA (cytosine-5)-methyltransferase 1 [Marivirga sericea]
MRTLTTDIENASVVEEPQLAVKFNSKVELQKEEEEGKSTLNMLSLFSGCGGMDLGFEGDFSVLKSSVNDILNPDFIEKELDNNFIKLKKTRFKTVFANDILKDARNAWVHYFSKRGHDIEDYQTDSIVDLVKLHQSGTKVFPENIDIVTGGFPCQDFSIAGKRNGFNSNKNHKGELNTETCATEETRGKLYMWMKQVIEITQPKIFIAENVKGLVNLSNLKDIIQSDFSSTGDNGYLVLKPRVLHAADYGVPQSRERVFFIGIKKSALKKSALDELEKEIISDKYNPYPKPTHAYTTDGADLNRHVDLKELFANIEEPEKSKDLSQKFYSKAKFMGKHCQGQIEIKPDGISPTIRAEHHGNIEFRRLSKKNGGILTEELSKGLKERRLTPRECGLIQTFPPDYEFVIENKQGRKGSYLVSPSKAYKIIGNAVPPLLAYNLAKRVESVWDLYFKK